MSIRQRHVDPVGDDGFAIDRRGCGNLAGSTQAIGETTLHIGRHVQDHQEGVVPIRSALFEAQPRNIIVLPVLFEDQVKAVIELASLTNGFAQCANS